jgi:formylglycine-generating enzyme required for sulfatase activity
MPSIKPSSIYRLTTLLAVALPFCLTTAYGQEKDKPVSKPSRSKLLKQFDTEFISITPGKGTFPKSFQMGSAKWSKSEQPVRTVTFGGGFSIAKYEVTQELYEAVMEKNPSVWGGPRNSVEMVSWQDAVRFCATATKLMRDAGTIEANEEIRLPTEAEWEYCCRAGTKTTYSFGDAATTEADTRNKASLLAPYGWHTGNAAGNDPPVGALKPNAWGLYDMHGYLWEYTADAWHGDYKDAPINGEGWDVKKQYVQRIVRGGSWRDRYEQLRSSVRWAVPDHVRSDAIGLRCVKAAVNDAAAD